MLGTMELFMTIENIVKKKGFRRLLIERCLTTGILYIYTDKINYEYFGNLILKSGITNSIVWKLTDVKIRYIEQGIKDYKYRHRSVFRFTSDRIIEHEKIGQMIIFYISKEKLDINKKQEYNKRICSNEKISNMNRISQHEYAIYED